MAIVTSPQGQTATVPDEVADSYIEQGWTAGVPAAFIQAWPDGDPAEGWKADELKAYAEHFGVDLTRAKKKPEIFAAIVAARTPAVDED